MALSRTDVDEPFMGPVALFAGEQDLEALDVLEVDTSKYQPMWRQDVRCVTPWVCSLCWLLDTSDKYCDKHIVSLGERL